MLWALITAIAAVLWIIPNPLPAQMFVPAENS
jgi:hypothetical protein